MREGGRPPERLTEMLVTCQIKRSRNLCVKRASLCGAPGESVSGLRSPAPRPQPWKAAAGVALPQQWDFSGGFLGGGGTYGFASGAGCGEPESPTAAQHLKVFPSKPAQPAAARVSLELVCMRAHACSACTRVCVCVCVGLGPTR